MTIRCEIESINYLNQDTRRVILRTPYQINFHAGQYLEIVLSDRHCPFSIASRPNDDNRLELHIRPTESSEDSDLIEHLLDTAHAVDIQLPMGKCFIDALPNGPVLLIAASTGVTQMKSIIEHLQGTGFSHEIFLYWGVLKEEDIYLNALCKNWSEANRKFFFAPVISEPALSPSWTGRTGLVGKIALDELFGTSEAKFSPWDMSNFSVYISGGAAMVYATLDMFVAKGLPKENIFSDMFSLAPRQEQLGR